jgi:sirohydrochlorin ferrochelatase
MKAILIIDHGSVRAEANEMLDSVGDLVQRMAGDDVIVRIAHMELAEPSVARGFAACVEAGATEIVAFPYMLSPGKHSTRDIPRMVAEAAAAFPRVSYAVTSAFGVNEKLAEVVLERSGVEPRAVRER